MFFKKTCAVRRLWLRTAGAIKTYSKQKSFAVSLQAAGTKLILVESILLVWRREYIWFKSEDLNQQSCEKLYLYKESVPLKND